MVGKKGRSGTARRVKRKRGKKPLAAHQRVIATATKTPAGRSKKKRRKREPCGAGSTKQGVRGYSEFEMKTDLDLNRGKKEKGISASSR